MLNREVTHKEVPIRGSGWIKITYEIIRNKTIIGTAFLNDSGTVTFESDVAAFTGESLDAAKKFASRIPFTIMEQMNKGNDHVSYRTSSQSQSP